MTDRSGRIVATVVVGVTAALAVVTLAGIRSYLARPPAPNALSAVDPRLALDETMLDIEEAANRGATPSQDSIARAIRQTIVLPMRPEPFVVAAIEAQGRGEAQRAEQLLLAARARDPRSVPARYFLADHFLRRGDIARSLAEVEAMLRLRSGSDRAFAPYFASLALDPRSRQAIAGLMKSDPALGRQILANMSTAGVSAPIVFDLARSLPRDAADKGWQANLVAAAVARGDLPAARAIWEEIVGAEGPMPLLRNPVFAPDPAPAPFSWTLRSSADGVAEADGRAGLSLLYYGRSTVILASQLLHLPAGTYRLNWKVKQTAGDLGTLRWRVTCAARTPSLGEAALRAGALRFDVATSCPFQQLELVATGQTSAPVEATVSNLSLVAA